MGEENKSKNEDRKLSNSENKKEKNNNLIEYKRRITKNLCYAVFDFVQKHGLCKA